MKLFFTITLLFTGITVQQTYAFVASKAQPIGISPKNNNKPAIIIKPEDWEKLTGKRMNSFQRIKLKLIQYVLNRRITTTNEPLTDKQAKQAKWSFILGIGSIVLLIIPFIGLLSLPAAIAGLILGIKSLKGNSNTKGIIGVVTSSVALLLLIIGVIALAIFFAGGW